MRNDMAQRVRQLALFVFLAAFLSANAWWPWSNANRDQAIADGIVQKMEAVKVAAYYVSQNPTDINAIQTFVDCKIVYVNHVNGLGADGARILGQASMATYVGEAETYVRQCLQYVNLDLLAYVMSIRGYYDFDGIYVYGVGCLDDLQAYYMSRYDNHPRWPKVYRRDANGAFPPPPAVADKKNGNAPKRPILSEGRNWQYEHDEWDYNNHADKGGKQGKADKKAKDDKTRGEPRQEKKNVSPEPVRKPFGNNGAKASGQTPAQPKAASTPAQPKAASKPAQPRQGNRPAAQPVQPQATGKSAARPAGAGMGQGGQGAQGTQWGQGGNAQGGRGGQGGQGAQQGGRGGQGGGRR